MAMMSTRDKPTYYNIVDAVTKVTVATAPKSKVLQKRAALEQEMGRKFEIELTEKS